MSMSVVELEVENERLRREIQVYRTFAILAGLVSVLYIMWLTLV